MKKKANLLLRKKNYQQLEKFFAYFRVVTFFLVAALFISIISLFLLMNSIKTQRQKLTAAKELLLTSIISRKDIETKALYFNQKGVALNTYLKDDVNFLPYYNQLQTYLPISSQSASIESIDYDNKRNVSVVLKFTNYDDFYNSLSSLQNSRFLSIFDSLSLEAFSITEAKVNNYSLQLVGKLKELK